jgi:hypothetical protein
MLEALRASGQATTACESNKGGKRAVSNGELGGATPLPFLPARRP